MKTKLKSNGFGSLQQLIAVLVDNEHAPKLLQLKEVKLLEQGKSQSLVQYPLWTTRADDDETLIYEIHYLCAGLKIPRNAWSIDWEKSSY